MNILEYKENISDSNILYELSILDNNFDLKNIDLRENKIFYMLLNNKLSGYSIVKLSEIPELKRIFVKRNIRNNGYGTKILQHTLNYLINENHDSLLIKEHNQMKNFLEKQGFYKEEDYYMLKGISRKRKRERKLISVARISFLINLILSVMKIVFGKIFFSSSLLADGFNSFADSISNFVVIIGLKIGGKPADKDHPYGHGKLESILSIVIGTFIIMTSIEILRKSISKLIFKSEIIIFSKILVYVSLVAIVIKIIQYMIIKRSIKYEKSHLMEALLKDYKADIFITLSVFLGVSLSKINPIFDSLIGILVALYVLKEGYEVLSEHANLLLDAQDEKFLEDVEQIIIQFENVENAHEFHMTKSGNDVFIYADIRVKSDMKVIDAHEITNEISKKIKMIYPNVKRVLLHIEPMYEIN